VLAVTVTAVTVLGGLALALAALGRAGEPGAGGRLWLALALGPGIGCGVVSVLYVLSVHLDLDPRLAWVAFAALVVAAGATVVRSEGVRALVGPRFEAGLLRRPGAWALGASTLVTVVVLVVIGWQWFTRVPYGSFDAVAMWNGKAVMLFRGETGELPGIFRAMKHGHPDYPLLLPGAVAAQYVLLGREDPTVPRATHGALVAGLGLLVVVVASALGAARLAVPGALVLLVTPAFTRYAFTQCADVPLGSMLLAAAFALAGPLGCRAADGPLLRCSPALAGLLLSLLAWTKNEGVFLALILVLVAVGFELGRGVSRADLGRWLVLGAGAAPGLITLVLFRSSWVGTSEVRGFLSDLPAKLGDPVRWWTILDSLWHRLDPRSGLEIWGLLPVVLIVGLGLATIRRAKAPCAALHSIGVSLAASFVCYMGFYLITPQPLGWHLELSLDRLLLHLAPLAVVWVLAAVASARGPAEAPR
jgi:hypothetical protein